MLRRPYPRRPESLSRELSATLKLKDIQEYYRLKERLQIKWWEMLVMTLLFVAGLGFILTVLYLLPPKNLELFFRFLVFWSVLLVIAVIGALEILMVKVRALYRLLNYQALLIKELENRLKKDSEEKVDPSSSARAKTGDESKNCNVRKF
ncbi:hypothetical protein J7M23_06260 [Candidatus Sumerlaeota bacterium]|nr:hypothetical protein [Candidatus Sumerlaeota bacterium]